MPLPLPMPQTATSSASAVAAVATVPADASPPDPPAQPVPPPAASEPVATGLVSDDRMDALRVPCFRPCVDLLTVSAHCGVHGTQAADRMDALHVPCSVRALTCSLCLLIVVCMVRKRPTAWTPCACLAPSVR